MAGYLAQKRIRYRKLFALWSRRVGFGRKYAYALIAAAVIAGSATIATISGTSSVVTDLSTVLVLLYIDLIILLLLAVVVGRRIVAIWAGRREHGAATRLHIRMAVFFGLVAVTPAIVVAVFSGLFLNFGIQSWFSERVRTAVHESEGLAVAYLLEHQKNIRADVLAIANDLNHIAPQLRADRKFFHDFLNTQTALRSLSEAVVVDGAGRTLARSGFSFSLEFELLSRQMLQRALDPMQSGNVIMIEEGRDDRVRAGIKLSAFLDAYLFAGRHVAPEVLDNIAASRNAANGCRSRSC
jgi:two-component system nitrogen regulation sensor histidine kinase NtrY